MLCQGYLGVQRFCLAGSRSTRVREPGRRETRTREIGRSLTSAGTPLGIPAPRKAVPDKGSASWPLLLPERALDWPAKGKGGLITALAGFRGTVSGRGALGRAGEADSS